MSKKEGQNNKKSAVIKKDFDWYLTAAEQGDAQAQCLVGIRYNKGRGVKENKEEALKWYKRSAKQGFPKAICLVGICYGKGWGVKENKRTAFKWYMKAAEQGLVNAQYLVGICYSKGEGVKQNKEESFKWIMKAAEQGDAKAQCLAGIRYSKGEGTEKNEKEAFNWLLKAAKQGDVRAQCLVGSCYGKGEGVKKNKEEALKWYKKAAEQGSNEAQYLLDLCYGNEKENKEKDCKLLKKSEKQDFTTALNDFDLRIIAAIIQETSKQTISELWNEINKEDAATKRKTKVFVIHGHNEAKLRELKEILKEQFKLEPVVLSEQPLGNTLIGKFEEYAKQCSYAFAIFTPDDKISNKKQEYFQARPNVIFELGWLYSYLGKDKVCILKQESENNSIFSDLKGIEYLPFKENISEKLNEIKKALKSKKIIKKSL